MKMRRQDNNMTKQEQRDEAKKEYKVIRDQAWKKYETYKEHKAIRDPAWAEYKVIRDQAWEKCLAKIEVIDEQEEEDIKIIDGKRYKLIEE